MGKRFVCLICAAVLIVMAAGGLRTAAAAWNGPVAVQCTGNGLVLAKALVKRSPNPLASAMFLVLAGLGIGMLFDKKNKD